MPHWVGLWTARFLPVLYLTLSSYMEHSTYGIFKSRLLLLLSLFKVIFLISGGEGEDKLNILLFEANWFFFKNTLRKAAKSKCWHLTLNKNTRVRKLAVRFKGEAQKGLRKVQSSGLW